MDSQIKLCRTLPPLVEGKIHGNLKLIIDEVFWIQKNLGDVTVVASWWGEHNNAQFRPKNNIMGTARTNEDITEIYAIKTNAKLFEDYIKNCDGIELLIVAEDIHKVIGKGYIRELSKIFSYKSYSYFIPILNNNDQDIGKIHVSLQLTYLTEVLNMKLETYKYKNDSDISLFAIDNLQRNKKISIISHNNADNTIKKKTIKSEKIDMYNTYKSVLKTKQIEFQESKKLNKTATDKLIAQIIAKAQHLREALIKETFKEDFFILNDTLLSNESYFNSLIENKKLYKHILEMEMASLGEKKVMNILRASSPSLNSVNLTSKTITAKNKSDNTNFKRNQNFSIKLNKSKEDTLCKNETCVKLKGACPLDYVNSIRIFIESFTLSPTGYRRTKSTCLQYGVPLSLTYFIRYDIVESKKQTNTKSNKKTKFIRTCAKKQIGHVVNFNFEGIYSISWHNTNKNFSLRFKVFVKHHNQKFPTGLGLGFVNISDIINTTHLSNIYCITIDNKGIKMGELKVIIELGCDFLYFGKEFIDAVRSRKQDISVLRKESLVVFPNNNKYKNATRTHFFKSNSKISSISAKHIEYLANNSKKNKDVIIAKDVTEYQEQNLNNKRIDASNPDNDDEDKVLLNGLIYVAEGKNLPESNTYLICKAFWRENKGTSQICNNTKNPFYHFFQYPVISVDGWINITDPVSGKICGELLALVALGTVEQIALLEVSRGLKNTSNISRIDYSALDRNLASVDYKSQESQTDISSLKNTRLQKSKQETAVSEHLALRTLIDHLANALHINKSNLNQSAQTEINQVGDEEEIHREESCLNILNSNSLDDSDNCNSKDDFKLSTEIYRSVGVSAEYDEHLERQQNNTYNNLFDSFLPEKDAQKIELNTNCNSSFFQSVVEIECALYLPKIEKINKLVEPSTYVTFQDLTHKIDSEQLDSYMITNIFPYSCNPKWNWRCNAKLSTDLLLNNQKRLIFKVWHLIDPDAFNDINLKRDIVIGFSAVDLSILMTGFSTISGWFHIIDFTGKCNGQIKINITPLGILPPLEKYASSNSISLSRCSNLSQTNWPHLFNTSYTNTEFNDIHQISSYANQNNDKYIQNHCKLIDADIGHNLDDVSMSFLSTSLKQKLTELDEITKRLQLRLRDVTNSAFEDEFDNDFEVIEPNTYNETINDKNIEIAQFPHCTISKYSEISQMIKQCEIGNDQGIKNEKNQIGFISNNCSLYFEPSCNQNKDTSSETANIEYYSNFNTRLHQYSSCYHNQYQNQYSSTCNYISSSKTEYPISDTKTHINHLLDKLSLDLPTVSSSEESIPIKKNILELFTSLQEHRNNLQDKNKDKDNDDTCTMLVQIDNLCEQSATNLNTSKITIGENISESPHNRISTIIREELITEENNDSINYDELTTYLITSNIRYMDLNSIFNPLLYQHIMSDLHIATTISSEGETVEKLDNRYAKSFDIVMHDNNINHLKKNPTLLRNNLQLKDETTVFEFDKNKEFVGLTSPTILRDIDSSSIDVTVIYKSSENDLTSGNSKLESIAIMSLDKFISVQQAEVKTETYHSIISELSVPIVSRQAPDGGNPIEEVKTSIAIKRQGNTQDVSIDS
ncbi:hypothetical protein P5V15_002866 [Pogonomyrmex californicus]